MFGTHNTSLEGAVKLKICTILLPLLCRDQRVLVVNHGHADRLVVSATHSALSSYQQAASSSGEEGGGRGKLRHVC